MPPHEDSTGKLTKAQGQMLVKLARLTIMEQLGHKPCRDDEDVLAAARRDNELLEKRGVFICLKIDHQLRGCIGSLSASSSIVEGVRSNAVNAAFYDPRFSPLSADEVHDVELEVSVLTEPQPLAYNDAEDLIGRLRVDVDGVILRKGGLSATFLPQVWEQLPDPGQFLSHLCMKAGLPSDAWRDTKLEIMTYQVQCFQENT